VNPFICLRGVVNWWMRTSQTSSSLASKVLNFWVLSLDQVIVILLSIVNFASKFLKDNEWFKFGVVMTSCHYVIFYVIWSHFGVHKATYAARKAEKLNKIQRMKTCHDLVKTWHDFGRPKKALDIEENVSRWSKRDTICGNPNSVVCYWKENVSQFNQNVTRF